jgi:hypothetical protein
MILTAAAIAYFLQRPPLTGTVPDTIGRLACRSKIAKLYGLAFRPSGFLRPALRAVMFAMYCCSDLGGNQITGTLPASLSALTALKHVYVPFLHN